MKRPWTIPFTTTCHLVTVESLVQCSSPIAYINATSFNAHAEESGTYLTQIPLSFPFLCSPPASRLIRRRVPCAGHLMTPRRLWLNKVPTQCDVVIEFSGRSTFYSVKLNFIIITSFLCPIRQPPHPRRFSNFSWASLGRVHQRDWAYPCSFGPRTARDWRGSTWRHRLMCKCGKDSFFPVGTALLSKAVFSF